jgi:superfamily I DNA and RNA helicase
MDDLEQMEGRIEELERYLGIENQNDLQYFIKNDIEKLDQKCIRLDDFVKVIEDKNFMLNDLYTKYEQLENFLKNGNKFTS